MKYVNNIKIRPLWDWNQYMVEPLFLRLSIKIRPWDWNAIKSDGAVPLLPIKIRPLWDWNDTKLEILEIKSYKREIYLKVV